ncbi:porin [Pigmentiphaga litoralis]|uniref:porin n=1 Tax=Pigmentiphaga litoralis TaxID=516702 RepID=UPI003B436686
MMCLFRPAPSAVGLSALSALALSAVALCGAPSLVHAQSNVTVYGLIDSAVRYSTHEGPDGSGKAQLSDGVLTGSRLGFRGAEALGGGYQAEFVLETGYSPDTGINQQGGACSAGKPRWACRAASAA